MYLLALWALLQTEMTDVPSFSYTKKNPYPLIYVKHEKGTPFGRSLDSYAIIESTPPPPPPATPERATRGKQDDHIL